MSDELTTEEWIARVLKALDACNGQPERLKITKKPLPVKARAFP